MSAAARLLTIRSTRQAARHFSTVNSSEHALIERMERSSGVAEEPSRILRDASQSQSLAHHRGSVVGARVFAVKWLSVGGAGEIAPLAGGDDGDGAGSALQGSG
ncbi:MAG TPA: hypothetical protein VIC60_10030, partial [Thermomicrobiales bacterium]